MPTTTSAPSFARDLREVAKVIYGVKNGVPNVHARFFELSNGGYDTHSDQGAASTNDQQYGLHHEVGDALKVFFDDCADMGVADKVRVVVWSEFSRRIQQNDQRHRPRLAGSDVRHRRRGDRRRLRQPSEHRRRRSTTTATPSTRRLPATRSARPTSATSTARSSSTGSNMPEPTIVSSILPLDSGDPATRWTTNNFDLGFLT